MDSKNNSVCPCSTKELMVPKHRFDEVNALYKAAKDKSSQLEEENKRQQTQIENLCKQIQDIKSGYEKAANILRVKEIFVSGGLTEHEYQDLVNLITKTNETDMCELASCITKLINKHKES